MPVDRLTCGPPEASIGPVIWRPAYQLPHIIFSMTGKALRANSEALQLLGYSGIAALRCFQQVRMSPWPLHCQTAFSQDLSKYGALRLLQVFRRANGEPLVCEVWCQWFEVGRSVDIYLIARDHEAETRWALVQRLRCLTEREREVLDLIMRGFSTLNISMMLKLSERTVESHRAAIHRKLGAYALADLIHALT